jgi:adenylylsulfate kinase-like enzyme
VSWLPLLRQVREKLFPSVDAFTPQSFADRDWSALAAYVGIYQNLVLDKYGASHSFFRINLPQHDVATDEILHQIQAAVRDCFLSMPPELAQTEIHATKSGEYGALLAEYERLGARAGLLHELRREQCAYLRRGIGLRNILKTEVMLVNGVLPANPDAAEWRKRIGDNGGNFAVKRRPMSRAEFARSAQTHRLAGDTLRDILRRVGGSITPLTAEEITGWFYRLFNQAEAIEQGLPNHYDYDRMPFVDGWMCGDFSIGRDSIRIGEYHHGMVSLALKPRKTRPLELNRALGQLDFGDFRTVIKIRRLDKEKEKQALKVRIQHADSMRKLGVSLLDAVISPHRKRDKEEQDQNVEATSELAEAKRLLQDLRDNSAELVAVQQNFHVWDRNAGRLREKQAKLAALLANVAEARGWQESRTLLPAFLSAMPGVYAPFYRPLKPRCWMAADLAPVERGLETDEAPRCLFGNAKDGLVPIDLRDRRQTLAPVTYISGAMGSGKSVVGNRLLYTHYQDGDIAVCLDSGFSYNHLFDALACTRIAFDRQVTINPFQMHGVGEYHQVVMEPAPAVCGKIAQIIEVLLTSKQTTPVTEAGRNTLARIVRATFAWGSAQRKKTVTLSDFAQHLAEADGGRELLERLRPFLNGGVYGAWFDGPATTGANRRALHVDFSAIVKDQQLMAALVPVVAVMVSELMLQHPGVNKILVFGEMWKFIANGRTAEIIVETFREYRKAGAIVIAESQTIVELEELNPAVATAVMQGAQTWILLPQGAEKHVNAAIKTLDLNQGQQHILKTLATKTEVSGTFPVNYREALLVRGHGPSRVSGKIRIMLTPLEYWTFTTAPEDVNYLRAVVNSGKIARAEAIRMLARQYPCGIAYGMVKD